MSGEVKINARMRDRFTDMSRTKLAELMQKESFFHDMLLDDGIRTGSWVYEDNYPANYHLWPLFDALNHIDLEGLTCLDVGTFDGMIAFIMAAKGAARVDATCQYDLDRFRQVRAYQGYKNLAYHPETDLKKISQTFKPASQDIVVMSAMLHHLTSPFDAFLEARRLLRRDGYFLVESIVMEGEQASLLLNTELEKPVYGAPTLFIPTADAVRGMLRLASFDIVSETHLLGGRIAREPNYDRMTFLARASRPSDVSDRNAKTEEIQTKAPKMGDLDFSSLEADKTRGSTIGFKGSKKRRINIWTDPVSCLLQPDSKTPAGAPFDTRFAVAREKDFLRLASVHSKDAFTWDDVYLLGAMHPGETMPEGMEWSLKQLGNLHVLDYVRKLGLSKVLEVGQGFNLYFPRHLPDWCDYAGIDTAGFYNANVLALADRGRDPSVIVDGLLGQSEGLLPSSAFDACISVSVLEHVPGPDVKKVCEDMLRVLKPGGWAVHSIDTNVERIEKISKLWLGSLQTAGFEIDPTGVDERIGGQLPHPTEDTMFLEPLSIRARYTKGFRKTVWGDPEGVDRSLKHMTTMLVAARKPQN
jgi:SAM-dependent methyltransferase